MVGSVSTIVFGWTLMVSIVSVKAALPLGNAVRHGQETALLTTVLAPESPPGHRELTPVLVLPILYRRYQRVQTCAPNVGRMGGAVEVEDQPRRCQDV